jgi:Icc-related predicted phosphoesterase
MGLKIWGSGITQLPGEPFGIGSPAERAKLYSTIPADVNILVTHTPPYGILDRSPGSLYHSGCPELREAVERIKPQLHVFGHIHGAHGMQSNEHTVFVNASNLGPDGDIAHPAIVLRMPRR